MSMTAQKPNEWKEKHFNILTFDQDILPMSCHEYTQIDVLDVHRLYNLFVFVLSSTGKFKGINLAV